MPKQVSTVKPYCKVCHDAGKSEKEYTSHYVKSAPGPEGKVVCPTLLAQCCGYCGNCGHTPKFCPVLAAQKVAEEKALKQAARKEAVEKSKAAPKPAPVKKQSSNVFAALDSDSDDEPKKVSKKVSQPQFIEPKPVVNVAAKPAAAKPAAAKLFANVNEFPSLSGATSGAAPKAAPKAVATQGKPQFLSAINQLCPQLNVAAKMPEVHIAKPQMAQLVRKQAAAEAEAQVEEYEEPEPSDFTMADYFEAAFQRPPMKASEMNWAETEDSDDEDW